MESRKGDHIELAFSSQVMKDMADQRFDYEPLLGSHETTDLEPFTFLGKTLKVPLWVSSMTGGNKLARTINTNLARACREFGMGMGLGSCRILMKDKSYLPDFDMRDIIGEEYPLYANIGIAQLEEMALQGSFQALVDLVGMLRADGLIVHINPIQEWIQDEGDRLKQPPLLTLHSFLEAVKMKVILKEVGQGMGPESIRHILNMPVEAFELAALGGTNFSRIELSRSNTVKQDIYCAMAQVGHSAEEMLNIINKIVSENQPTCRQIIISGGIRSFLDGYFLLSKSKLPAIYGQASGFLKYARGDYHELKTFVELQIEGLKFARAYLKPKTH